MTKPDRKQTDTKGRFVKGNTVAKDKGVDFGSKPENRHHGAWKKEDTPRYKLERMIRLDENELDEVINDVKAPMFERKLCIAVKEGNWMIARDIIDQVYGKSKESVDMTSNGETIGKSVEVLWSVKKK